MKTWIERAKESQDTARRDLVLNGTPKMEGGYKPSDYDKDIDTILAYHRRVQPQWDTPNPDDKIDTVINHANAEIARYQVCLKQAWSALHRLMVMKLEDQFGFVNGQTFMFGGQKCKVDIRPNDTYLYYQVLSDKNNGTPQHLDAPRRFIMPNELPDFRKSLEAEYNANAREHLMEGCHLAQ